MRVLSLVPSWTETLLEAGVDVVGRTRFCIHPEKKVKAIPIVGGTKSWDLEKVKALRPDLILLDREENPVSMTQEAPFPWIATHVTSASEMPAELARLAEIIKAPHLNELETRWENCLAHRAPRPDWAQVPGLVQWVKPPHEELRQFVYLIWQKPWMAVGRETFIGSMWRILGWGDRMQNFPGKYPEVELEDFDPATTALFFSTEPYPFSRQIAEIKKLPHSTCLVDGEAFSWFGLRGLRFLENCSKTKRA